MILAVSYSLLLAALTIFSYGFVDANFPFRPFLSLFMLVNQQHAITGTIYTVIIILLFCFYFFLLSRTYKKKITTKYIWQLIVATSIILFLSFPAFSYDIFNYIATAKVAFLYKENPYIVMPIDIRNEPLLAFMHAANKTALYGPVWIILTIIPFVLGMNNLWITIFSFKLFTLFFYLGLTYFIWKLSNKNNVSLVYFAFNPLVLIEALVSSHNDVVMIFFALFSFLLIKEKKLLPSLFFFLFSILIKFATLFLIPVYAYTMYASIKNRSINWKYVWTWSAISMYIIFFLSPLREELYEWYFIWPLSFVALNGRINLFSLLSIAFSFGLSFRIVPFLFTASWSGKAPIVKKIVSFLPVIFVIIGYVLKKKN